MTTGAPTSTIPPLQEAVRTLRRGLRSRATSWLEVARDLTSCDAAQRGQRLAQLDADLRAHLAPYVELLDHELDDDERSPLLHTELESLRRCLRRIHHVATAGELHPHAAQAAVATLHQVLLDHLRGSGGDDLEDPDGT